MARHFCRRCGIRKPLNAEHFYRDTNRPLGFRPTCICCMRAMALVRAHARYQRLKDEPWFREQNTAHVKSWRQRNPERFRAYQRAYQRKDK
jgi:hypothetical protein